MRPSVETKGRDAVLVQEAALLRVMGMPVLEAVPSRGAPYELTHPFILVHEGRFRPSEMAGRDTRHPHRGFDNIWYVLQGSASTGTPRARTDPWTGPACRKDRSSGSGRAAGRGTPRPWRPTRSMRAGATPSSEGCCSG